MRSKLSTFFLASTALAAAALATIPAVADTTTKLNVPFSFTVNGRSLPAGIYSIHRDSNFVRLVGKDATESFTWVAAPSAAMGDKVILRFDPQGVTHALQSVQYGPLVTTTLDRKSRKSEEVSPQYVPGQ
ncbi:MAG: hypothetical protein ACLPY1_23995 [Terracidiphilus sp.]